MEYKLVKSCVHNLKWILNEKGKIVGALHDYTYCDLDDILNTTHIRHHYLRYLKEHSK